MDTNSILQRFSFYREAPAGLRTEILTAGEYVHLPAGTYFYHEGDLCQQVAVVGRGNIRVFKAGDMGQEISLYLVQDDESCLVNMLCVFLDRPAMATAIVEAPTDAVVVPAARFRHWVETATGVRRFVFESVATRLVDVFVLVESLASRKMDERLARLLLDRFSHEDQSVPVIAKTHEELARELGTAREVVSRVIKEFERLGAISAGRGRIELVDRRVLAGLIQGH